LDGLSYVFEHNDFGLTINFSTLNFEKQYETRYQIKLSGEEVIEYPEAKENQIIFPQLSPGSYVFSVVSINPKDGKKSKPAQLNFNVNYPPFRSPKSYSIYFLFSLFGVWLWLQKRRKQQQVLLAAHAEVAESEKRLKLALKGSGSGEWDWSEDKKEFFEPRIYDDLEHNEFSGPLSFSQHISLIHNDDKKLFKKIWKDFVDNNKGHFDCTYRLKMTSGEWLWYRDLGRVVLRNIDGTPQRITGTYTNITNTRANEEKAKLFGEAF